MVGLCPSVSIGTPVELAGDLFHPAPLLGPLRGAWTLCCRWSLNFQAVVHSVCHCLHFPVVTSLIGKTGTGKRAEGEKGGSLTACRRETPPQSCGFAMLPALNHKSLVEGLFQNAGDINNRATGLNDGVSIRIRGQK